MFNSTKNRKFAEHDVGMKERWFTGIKSWWHGMVCCKSSDCEHASSHLCCNKKSWIQKHIIWLAPNRVEGKREIRILKLQLCLEPIILSLQAQCICPWNWCHDVSTWKPCGKLRLVVIQVDRDHTFLRSSCKTTAAENKPKQVHRIILSFLEN